MSIFLLEALVSGNHQYPLSENEIKELPLYIKLVEINEKLSFLKKDLFLLIWKNRESEEVIINSFLAYLECKELSSVEELIKLIKIKKYKVEGSKVIEAFYSSDLESEELILILEALSPLKVDYNVEYKVAYGSTETAFLAEVFAEEPDFIGDARVFREFGLNLRKGRKKAIEHNNEEFLKLCDYVPEEIKHNFKGLIEFKSQNGRNKKQPYVDAFMFLIEKKMKPKALQDFILSLEKRQANVIIKRFRNNTRFDLDEVFEIF